MTTLSQARLYGTFEELKCNTRRKKLHSTNQGPIFLDVVLAIETMKVPESNLKEKDSSSILEK